MNQLYINPEILKTSQVKPALVTEYGTWLLMWSVRLMFVDAEERMAASARGEQWFQKPHPPITDAMESLTFEKFLTV